MCLGMIIGTVRILPPPNRRADVLEVLRSIQGPVRAQPDASPAKSTTNRAVSPPSSSSSAGSPTHRSMHTFARTPTGAFSAPSNSRAARPEIRFEHVSPPRASKLIEVAQSRNDLAAPMGAARHESHHRRRSSGRRIVRGAIAQTGRAGRNPDGGARAVRLVRELRAAVPRRRRDRGGVEPPGGDRADVPRRVQRRSADRLRGDRRLAGEEDGGPA